MMALVLALLLQQQETQYAEISKKYQLGEADRLMLDGKYLEAAVAYRNALLQPGEREAVRVPFALALFAHGDTSYAGIELRRAQNLYDGFTRLNVDAAVLFGSRGSLAKIADKAARDKPDGDGAETQAALAYVFHLVGETDPAIAAVDRYVQARGEDQFARAMRAKLGLATRNKPAMASTTGSPPETDQLQRRVDQIAPTARAESPKVGEPVRVGVRFLEPLPRPKGEILEK